MRVSKIPIHGESFFMVLMIIVENPRSHFPANLTRPASLSPDKR
jgi:hypothetical protein